VHDKISRTEINFWQEIDFLISISETEKLKILVSDFFFKSISRIEVYSGNRKIKLRYQIDFYFKPVPKNRETEKNKFYHVCPKRSRPPTNGRTGGKQKSNRTETIVKDGQLPQWLTTAKVKDEKEGKDEKGKKKLKTRFKKNIKIKLKCVW